MKNDKSKDLSLAALYEDREIYRALDARLSFDEKTALLGQDDDYLAYRQRLLKLARKYGINISDAR